MKKLLIILSAGAICCFTSCGSKKDEGSGVMSDKAKANIAASHVVSDAFTSGDVSKIDDVIAKDFVDHTDMGDKVGPDSLKANITMMHNMNKDMKMETIKDMADDDYVFSWEKFSGTSDGSMGMPKGPYEMTAIEAIKFKDGKAIEHWSFMEPREVMKMMGGAAPAMPMQDTAKTKM